MLPRLWCCSIFVVSWDTGTQPAAEPDADDLGDALRRWLVTTETTIRWSDSTRADWDRHLRPMLARRYEMATGQRQSKDPAAFHASGQMLFGAELWEWVNPNNVTRTGPPSPVPAVRPWKRFCEGWSRYEWGCYPDMTLPAAMPAGKTTAHCEAVLDEIERVVVGKRSALTLILTAVLARGHVLIEDLPGLGKTLIARSFAAALGLRIHAGAVHARICYLRICSARPSTTCSRAASRSGRTHLHQPVARRRDQPHAAEDPGGVAGGDGRRPGEHRRRNP